MNREPSNQVAADLRLTPYGHRDPKWQEYAQELLSQSFEQQQQQADNTETKNSSIQAEAEVEAPALEEGRIVTECLKNNKHQVGIRYRQKYIKLEVQLRNSESITS